MINRKQELLQNKPKKPKRKIKYSNDEQPKKIKPDTSTIIVDLTAKKIRCKTCGAKEAIIVDSKFYNPELVLEIEKFKKVHLLCKTTKN